MKWLHKISSSSIKQKIVYENNRIIGKNNDINSSHNLRVNSQDSIFTVIEKENDFTTYLLPISNYTTENPFFLKYIITVDVNNIEKSGYIKYIPSTPSGILNLGTFSGTVEVYNIEDELIGLTTFEDGIALPATEPSENSRIICYEKIVIVPVECGFEGHHQPGEPCENGVYNSYWSISITTVCNYDPTTIVQIIDDSSNPSMGGGSSNLNPNNSTLNKIIANLTMAQLDWWYSQNTSQETRDAIVNYVNENNATQNEEEDAIDFVKELIDDVNQNNLSPQESKDYIISNIIVEQIDDSQLNECAKGILTELKELTQSNIAEIFQKLGATNSKYKTTISSENTGSAAVGSTGYKINSPISHYEYIIKIKPSHSDGGTISGTHLGIASTILHELIHAYFFSIIDDCYVANNCTLLQSFPDLWNHYVNSTSLINGVAQHNQIANNYVNILASSIQEFATGVEVTDNNQIQQIYKDLAWGGLEGTIAYNNLSEEDKIRIKARNRAENYNQPSTNPSGIVIATPQGSPCN